MARTSSLAIAADAYALTESGKVGDLRHARLGELSWM